MGTDYSLRHPDDLWDSAMLAIFPLPNSTDDRLPTGNNTAATNVRFLAEYYPEVLDRVVASCSDPELLRVWQSKLQKEILSTPDTWEHDETINQYERMLAVLPTVARIVRNDPDNNDLRSSLFLIDGAVKQLLRVSKGIEILPAEILSAIAIVLYVRGAYSLQRYTSGSTLVAYADIEEDARWIAEHISEVERHIPVLMNRQTHDYRFIEVLIEAGSGPVSQGSL